MTIFRDERKVLWTRKNAHHQQGTVDLVVENNNFLSIRHSQSPNEVLLTKKQLFEMIEETATHFEQIVVIENVEKPCPKCEIKNFEYKEETVSFFGKHRYFKKVCATCGLSGPRARTQEEANDEFEQFFYGDSNNLPFIPVSVQKELARR